MVLRNVILIALGFQLMLNMTRPLITLFASDLGASITDIGLLTSAYAFFPLLFAVHAGRIADRIGDRIPVLAGLTGTAVGLAIPVIAPTMASLYVSQVIVGISHILINISLQNVLGNAATKENRDRYFSLFSMVVALGGFIGPVFGGYLTEHITYSAAFTGGAVMGILPIAAAFWLPVLTSRSAKKQPARGGNPLVLLKLPLIRKALASSALVLYSRDIFVAYFPLLAAGLGMSVSSIGWIIAIQGLAMVAVRLFLSPLTVRFGRHKVLLLSIMTAGVMFLLMPLAGHEIWFGIISALMGIGLGCGQPLSMTTTYNASPKDRTGEVLGLRIASNRLSQMLAPLLFGLIGSSAGIVSVFYVSGAFLIGGAFATRTSVSDEEEAG